MQDFDDLTKLPYLKKNIVRENLPYLITHNYPKFKLEYETTSGSTGIPLCFYWDKCISRAKERAFILSNFLIQL